MKPFADFSNATTTTGRSKHSGTRGSTLWHVLAVCGVNLADRRTLRIPLRRVAWRQVLRGRLAIRKNESFSFIGRLREAWARLPHFLASFPSGRRPMKTLAIVAILLLSSSQAMALRVQERQNDWYLADRSYLECKRHHSVEHCLRRENWKADHGVYPWPPFEFKWHEWKNQQKQKEKPQ